MLIDNLPSDQSNWYIEQSAYMLAFLWFSPSMTDLRQVLNFQQTSLRLRCLWRGHKRASLSWSEKNSSLKTTVYNIADDGCQELNTHFQQGYRYRIQFRWFCWSRGEDFFYITVKNWSKSVHSIVSLKASFNVSIVQIGGFFSKFCYYTVNFRMKKLTESFTWFGDRSNQW